MKSLKVCLLVLCALVFATQAHALLIQPGDAVLFGNETSQAEIDVAINAYLGFDADELYKSNVGGAEEGPLAGSYDTDFSNTPSDPSDADIEYTGGEIVGPEAYLLVKDGAQIPAWYFFNLTDLGWNGTDTLNLMGFWPDQGAISHVSLYGSPQQVPEPATMLLLGFGLVGLAAFGRRKVFKK
jgi:hypothetical protein